MRFEVLGSLRAIDAKGGVIDVGGGRQRRLLAALLVNLGSVVSDERLTEMVWSEDDLPDGGVRALRTVLSRLRNSLDASGAGVILTRPPGYVIERHAADTDAVEFERHVSAGVRLAGSGDHARAIESIAAALALWRGEPYAEFVDDEWSRVERVRLEEVRATAQEVRAECALAIGDVRQAIIELEGLVSLHPFRERLHRLYATALYRAGRHTEALRHCQRYRDLLADELGLDPSAEMRALELQILNQAPELAGPTATTERLKSYELLERIGAGSWGVVWRARQPSIEREVAVKIVNPEIANQPEFIARFETEARIVAALEHPHVLPVYDFWRDPTGAYLVTRLMRGGSAADRLRSQGEWDVPSVTALVEQIGSALAVAHASGVLHRDVKPSNILLDGSGNFVLSDFGIALERDHIGEVAFGGAAHIAPEQRDGWRVGPSGDVYGLAVTAWELLTGIRPQAAPDGVSGLTSIHLRRPEAPPQLDVPIRRATAIDPAARYGDVSEFVDAFVVAAGATPRSYGIARVEAPTIEPSERRPLVNPYKGLRPFGVEDAPDFFGRDDAARQVVHAIARSPFVAVVGPSGAGKSSLVAAGVVPAIRRGDLRGSDRWYIASMTPGANPFHSLESALLRIATDVPASLAEQLAGGSDQFVQTVNRVVGTDHALLVIDQFEEIYTQFPADVAARFAAGLAAVANHPAQRLHVLVTLRADFFDRPLADPDLAPLLNACTVPLGAMSAGSLELAITAPASRAGSVVDPALVATMIRDAEGQPAVLPLLQYMLTELFDRGEGSVLTLSAYESLGGLGGVVARRAEAIVEDVGPTGALATRRVFGRLVSLGDGTADTRRRARRSELVSSGDDLAGRVLDRFGAGRLLVFDHDATTREPTVEIAHEALLTSWPRLRNWLDEDREVLRTVSRISSACSAWEQGGQQHADLLRGGRLTDAMVVTQVAPERLSDLEHTFVADSQAATDAERLRQRRARRRLATALAVSIALLCAAVIAGTVAVRSSNRADATAFAAQTQYLISESGRLAELHPDTAMLLAIEARRREQSVDTLGALQRVYAHKPHAWLGTMWIDSVWDVAFLPDGSLVTAGKHELAVWDMADRTKRWVAPASYLAVASSADGRVIAAADPSRYTVYDAETGDVKAAGRLPADAAVTSVGVSADGTSVAVGTQQGELLLASNIGSDAEPLPVEPLTSAAGFTVAVESIAFDGTGQRLAYTGPTGVGAVLWDLERDVQVGDGPLLPHGSNPVDLGGPGGVVFVGDQLWVASTFLRAFAASDGEPRINPNPLGDMLDGVGGDAAMGVIDGEVVLASAARTIAVDLDSGEVRSLPIVPNIQLGIDVDPGHGIVARGTYQGVELWAIDGAGIGVVDTVPRVPLGGFANISSDGSTLVSSTATNVETFDHGLGEIWDLRLGERIGGVEAPGDVGLRVSGNTVIRVAEDTFDDPTAIVGTWDAVSGRFIDFDQVPNRTWVRTVGATEDYVAVGWVDATVEIFDRRTRADVRTISIPFDQTVFGEHQPNDLEFTPDGSHLIATTLINGVVIIDTATWEIVDTIAPTVRAREAEGAGFQDIVFSPDGRYAVTYSNFYGLQVRDATTLRVLRRTPSQSTTIYWGRSLDISADGSIIVVQSDQGPRLYDFESLEPVGDPYPHEGWGPEGPSATYAHDVDWLATNVGDSVVVLDIDPEMWGVNACLLAGRNLSRGEWQQYRFTEPYRLTCPQWGEPTDTIGQTAT